MHLFLLGATGRTGQLTLLEALRRGHRVNVLVRDPGRLPVATAAGLTIFTGLPTDIPVLENALRNCDALISTLNLSRTSDWPWSPLRSPEDFLSRSMGAILAATARTGLRRIVITSASGVGASRAELPGWFDWFIRHSNLRFPYADHERQENLLAASSLDWTIVRPTGLTNGRSPQRIRVSLNGTPRPRLLISRASVARFLLDTVESSPYLRQSPTISSE